MSERKETFYFKPHPKSRLAFLEECVLICCKEETAFIDAQENMAAVAEKFRNDIETRIGSRSADQVDHFVDIQLAAFRNDLTALGLRSEISKITATRPKKGNLRRHIPSYLPLRPTRAIIATYAQTRRSSDYPSANALYNHVAEHFSHGIPRKDAGYKLSARNTRSACESFGSVNDDDASFRDNYRRAVYRYQKSEAPHIWDWNLWDALVWQRIFEQKYGIDTAQLTTWLSCLLRDFPLVIFGQLYDEAYSDASYSGLRGVDLAREIDARHSLNGLVAERINGFAQEHPASVGRTANVVA